MSRPDHAPGRLNDVDPVSIVDIGSNSVRLVVYEGLRRNPTPIFNEKLLAGLGRGIATTGRLNEEGVSRALAALARFRALSDNLKVNEIFAIATAAARDAENGAAFVADAEKVLGCPVKVLGGDEEARLSALGVICGFRDADGVVGDLGGGSLELARVAGGEASHCVSLPLGGLRLIDETGGNVKKATRLIRQTLSGASAVEAMAKRPFYAIGGTFRALATVHMAQKGYPLHVMHAYAMPAAEALDFAAIVKRTDPTALAGIDQISRARRPLLTYGAAVLEQIIRRGKPKAIVLSALGVREGLLYSLLPPQRQLDDPLIAASEELAILRSRSPRHARELCRWTDQLFGSELLPEDEEERRLRHAACLLADIGWRAHPDYRSEQSLNIIANAGFVGIDHAGRAFLALTVYYRYVGLIDEHMSPSLRELASTRLLDHARLLGAMLRVAYLISGSAPGIIERTVLAVDDELLSLTLPAELAALNGERLQNRLNALGKLIGRSARITIGPSSN